MASEKADVVEVAEDLDSEAGEGLGELVSNGQREERIAEGPGLNQQQSLGRVFG